VALKLLRAEEHLPAHRCDAPPRPAVSLVRVTTVRAMSVARRGSIVTSAHLAPFVTTTLADPAPVVPNATLAPPAAPGRSVALQSLAIVGRPATVTRAVIAAPVVTATVAPLIAVSAMTANLVTIVAVTAETARPVVATSALARIGHVMTVTTDVPRLAPIVTIAAPRVSAATTDRELTDRGPIAPRAATAMIVREPIDSGMTATRAPVAATTATSVRADSRLPRMSFSTASTQQWWLPKTWTVFRLATSASVTTSVASWPSSVRPARSPFRLPPSPSS
jgi:hypothetical protein